jgi:hypothetical protein
MAQLIFGLDKGLDASDPGRDCDTRRRCALSESAVGDMPNASHAWTDHRALAALLRGWWYCLRVREHGEAETDRR